MNYDFSPPVAVSDLDIKVILYTGFIKKVFGGTYWENHLDLVLTLWDKQHP